MDWDKNTQQKYEAMIAKIPVFHREMTKRIVPLKAEENAKARSSALIEEKDVVSAFLTEVPKAFYSLMIRLMDEVKFDYKNCLPKER